MFFDDGTLSIQREDLQGSTESVDQDGEEEHGTPRVETLASGLKVVEDGGDNECHDEVAEQLSKSQARVCSEPP